MLLSSHIPFYESDNSLALLSLARILYSCKNWRWRGKLETLRDRKYMCVVQNETGQSNKVDASCNKASDAWAINLLEWAQHAGVFPGLPVPLAAHHLFTPKDKIVASEWRRPPGQLSSCAVEIFITPQWLLLDAASSADRGTLKVCKWRLCGF